MLDLSLVENNEFTEKDVQKMFVQRIEENSLKTIEGLLSLFMFDCAYSPNGENFAIGSYKEVHIIDVKSGEPSCILTDHTDSVFGVSFSKDGHMFATCSNDESIIIYCLPQFAMMCRLKNDTRTMGICFSTCSNFIYSVDNNYCLKKWDINCGAVVSEKQIHSASIGKIKLSMDGKYILTGSYDHTVKLIDVDDFSVVNTFNHEAIIITVEFHPTKRIVLASDRSKNLNLWSMVDGSLLHSFKMGGNVWDFHFLTPSILFVMAADGFIISFNVDTFEEVQRVYCGSLTCHFSFAISPDMRQLACGRFEDSTIKFYSIGFDYSSSNQPKLIEMSKKNGFILSKLFAMNVEVQFIRQLISAGIWMNFEEYKLVVDTCWDLYSINKANGGNMCEFVDVETDESDDDN
eukprot:TRINITY_DN9460_c0_g1_i1.p1 TRINITY_DN9460_c0_g1~~TRINITY_DN9460_c0_g1_i1.p1  ORF type:complete len:404 (-),score=82.68 TRINITY_DN9460_c0_g1_i1:22-1233(-)